MPFLLVYTMLVIHQHHEQFSKRLRRNKRCGRRLVNLDRPRKPEDPRRNCRSWSDLKLTDHICLTTVPLAQLNLSASLTAFYFAYINLSWCLHLMHSSVFLPRGRLSLFTFFCHVSIRLSSPLFASLFTHISLSMTSHLNRRKLSQNSPRTSNEVDKIFYQTMSHSLSSRYSHRH